MGRLSRACWLMIGACGLVAVGRPPASALTMNCPDQITQRAAACITARGLASAAACRAEAEAAGCAAGPYQATPACAQRAKLDVDWVFGDQGARGTFAAARRSGLSPFEAVLRAQGHNPPVQANLRNCQTWVEGYLGGGPPQPPSDRPALTAGACRCISVVPMSGLDFSVSNTCGALRVSVQFNDAMNTTRASWVEAGTVGGITAAIRAPNYELTSIAAIRVADVNSSFTCRY